MSNPQNDAFERLKKRPRATVPARNKSLTDRTNDDNNEFSHSSLTESSHLVKDKIINDATAEFVPASSAQNQEVIRRTLRIDKDVDEQLEQLCAKEKITRETFLEACYLFFTQDPDLIASILVDARQRYHQRKQAGEKRKFETMSKKYVER